MPAKLYELIRKIYYAYPLMIGTIETKPGTLLEADWDWLSPEYPMRFVAQQGRPWEILNVPAEPYESELLDASIITGQITDKFRFGTTIAAPQFGLAGGASLIQKNIAKLTIGAIKVRRFKERFAEYELRMKLRQLKDTDCQQYAWVDNSFLVTDCYYTTDLHFEFKKENGFNPQALYENLDISEGFKVRWDGRKTLLLQGTADVPFAVRGIKV